MKGAGTTPGGVPVPFQQMRVKPANGHTYTLEEFHQATGKGPENYNRYLTYVANHRAKAIGDLKAPYGGVDPYAAFRPTSPQDGMAQATKMGMAAFAPSIAGVQGQYGRDATQFTDLLGRYNKDMAAYLRPQVQGALDVGQQTAAALAAEGAALGGIAKGQAAEGQGKLADFLSLINAPQEARQFATQAGQRGDQMAAGIAAAANMAQNNATIGQGVQGNFLAALPRIQEIAGRQDLVGGLRGFAKTRDDQLASLRGNRAEQIQKLYSDYMNREFDKATALQAFGINTQELGAKQTAAAAASMPKPVKMQKIVDYNSGNVYSYNPETGETVQTGRVKPHPASGGGKGGSPRSFQVDKSKAITAVDKALKRWARAVPQYRTEAPTKVLGVTVPGKKTKVGQKTVYVNYQRMLRDAVSHAKPLLSPYMNEEQITQFVKRLVDVQYTPGKYGFPLTPEMKAAAQRPVTPTGVLADPATPFTNAWIQSAFGR